MFLNPEGENPAQGDSEVNLDDLIQQHTGQAVGGEEPAAENEQVEIVVLSSSEALQAVELLQRYQEH